jgi:predicted RNase H-like HicB family nuclease
VILKYEIIMYWSVEDKAFICEVPELPGCLAHGDTQTKALRNVQDAMKLWLDVARENGDPIPQPKGRRLMYA